MSFTIKLFLTEHVSVIMAKVSNYTTTRIELLHKQGLLPAELFTSLKAEGLLVSISSIVRIIKKLKITGSMANRDTFHYATFSDESSISLTQYPRTCYSHSLLQLVKRKPKPKHHVSKHGATKICIFDGIMDADLF